MQLHVSLCGTTVVGSSLENSALSGKLELKLRSLIDRRRSPQHAVLPT